MFGHMVYSLDEPGPSIETSGPHEEFFNSDFGIWMGGFFAYGLCIPICVHEVCRALILRKNIVVNLSSLWHDLDMR